MTETERKAARDLAATVNLDPLEIVTDPERAKAVELARALLTEHGERAAGILELALELVYDVCGDYPQNMAALVETGPMDPKASDKS